MQVVDGFPEDHDVFLVFNVGSGVVCDHGNGGGVIVVVISERVSHSEPSGTTVTMINGRSMLLVMSMNKGPVTLALMV
jgi:hypothetical protein